jgi:hypothetical protein
VRMLLVAPPGVTLTGDGISAAGQEQGMNVFLHEALAAKGALAVSVSGVGSPPAAEAANSQGQQQGQDGNSRTQGQQVDVAPPRIDDLKWSMLFGLVALFALGAILLSRKQVVVAPAAEPEDPAPAQSKKAAKAARQQADIEAVKESVNANLDALKEDVFRLELRKQAGTISEEDYAREKSRVEKLLRDLVRS